jgi:hypothetical protein
MPTLVPSFYLLSFFPIESLFIPPPLPNPLYGPHKGNACHCADAKKDDALGVARHKSCTKRESRTHIVRSSRLYKNAYIQARTIFVLCFVCLCGVLWRSWPKQKAAVGGGGWRGIYVCALSLFLSFLFPFCCLQMTGRAVFRSLRPRAWAPCMSCVPRDSPPGRWRSVLCVCGRAWVGVYGGLSEWMWNVGGWGCKSVYIGEKGAGNISSGDRWTMEHHALTKKQQVAGVLTLDPLEEGGALRGRLVEEIGGAEVHRCVF